MQQNSTGFDWNEATIGKLRSLWDEGVSTAEIGRRLGVSKNAVVGKAHRLNLPERPSPIQRTGTPNPPRVRPPSPPKLPPLPSLTANPTVIAAVSVPVPRRAPSPIPATPALFQPLGTQVTPCCWPIGEPRKPGFHFCGEDSLPGRPYCYTHCRLGYARLRKRNAA